MFAVEERERLLHEDGRAGGDRAVDEVGRSLAADPLVLVPRAQSRHLRDWWDLGRDVHHRVVSRHCGSDGIRIEQVDADGPDAERLEQRLFLGRSRHAGDLMPGSHELGHCAPAQHAGRSRHEHAHLVPSPFNNPDTTYPN